MTPSSDRDWFPPAIERFVNAVEAGEILKSTEFAGATSVTVSNQLRDAGSCKYDSGAIVANGTKIVLLFHCHSVSKEQGLGVWVNWNGSEIKQLDITANEIAAGAKTNG